MGLETWEYGEDGEENMRAMTAAKDPIKRT